MWAKSNAISMQTQGQTLPSPLSCKFGFDFGFKNMLLHTDLDAKKYQIRASAVSSGLLDGSAAGLQSF